jgi:hypothetical protein
MRTILSAAAVLGLIGALDVPVSAQPKVDEIVLGPEEAGKRGVVTSVRSGPQDARFINGKQGSRARQKAADDTAAARAAKQT